MYLRKKEFTELLKTYLHVNKAGQNEVDFKIGGVRVCKSFFKVISCDAVVQLLLLPLFLLLLLHRPLLGLHLMLFL
jgi:hypothetical protein